MVPATTAEPIAESVIGDLVWIDEDGDGQQDSEDVGLPNVTVRLLGSDGEELAATITDWQGEFLFAGLPAATYDVEVVLPEGHAATTANIGLDETIDVGRQRRSARRARGPHRNRFRRDSRWQREEPRRRHRFGRHREPAGLADNRHRPAWTPRSYFLCISGMASPHSPCSHRIGGMPMDPGRWIPSLAFRWVPCHSRQTQAQSPRATGGDRRAEACVRSRLGWSL